MDLHGDLADVSRSYVDPFTATVEKSLGKEIVIDVPEREDGYIRRKWKTEIEPSRIHSIEQGKEAYTNYLKKTQGTANKEVWKVYDHLTSDLLADIMGSLMNTIDKDLDQYCEKVIYDEFQLGL